MNYLIDTNILLRLSQPQHPMASQALNALSILKKRGENLYLTSQIQVIHPQDIINSEYIK